MRLLLYAAVGYGLYAAWPMVRCWQEGQWYVVGTAVLLAVCVLCDANRYGGGGGGSHHGGCCR